MNRNVTVRAPTSAVTGSTAAIAPSFSGLVVGTKDPGSVAYRGMTGSPDPAIVRRRSVTS
jgi:hypothetical protein